MSKFWNHLRNAESSQEPSLAEEEVAIQEAMDQSMTNRAIKEKDDIVTIEVPSTTLEQETRKDIRADDLDEVDKPLTAKDLPSPFERQQPRPKEQADANIELDKQIQQADDPLEPIINKFQQQGGIMRPDGTMSTDPNFLRLKAQEELDKQDQMRMQIDEDTFEYDPLDEEGATQKLQLQGIGKDSVSSLVTAGAMLDDAVNNAIKPTMASQAPLDQRVGNILVAYQLADPVTKQVYPKVSNALSIQLIETIQDEINKRDEQRRGKYNSSFQEGVTISFDQERERSAQLAGQTVNPDYLRGSVTRGTLDKLMTNYNQIGGTNLVTGRGGGSKNIDDEAIAAIDTIVWQAIKDIGFIEEVTITDPKTGKPEETYYGFSQAADDFYNSTRDVLGALQPDRRIDVSSTPTVGGQALQGMERFRPDVGAYSLKSMMDKNLAIENRVKNNLGKIAYRVSDSGLAYAEKLVNSIIQVNQDGVITGLNNQSDIGFFSTSSFAETINLNEAKWRKSQARAANRLNANQEGITDEERSIRMDRANEQADRVMRQEARKILQTLKDMQERKGQVFYNKWFHATAVGRYFVRNTILNPLDSKLVRMAIESPKKNTFDLKFVTANSVGSDANPESPASKMENWVYIIGKNLLGNDDTNNVPTEDMGWNSILRITRRIMNNGPTDATYQRWLNTGKKFREFVNNPDAVNADTLKAIIDDSGHTGSFLKNDEWGFKLQSFIDFANWHDANQNKNKGTGSTVFEGKARTQHDGKQSGIAIQAMQNGKLAYLNKVGVIYSNEDNVIPQGDIRGKFMQTLIGEGIGVTFKGDPAKEKMYADTFRELLTDKEKFPSIAKDISKVPLMEVSYGKSPMFNQETVVNFLNNPKYAQVLAKHFDLSGIDENVYERADVIKDMNRLIEVTLNQTLETNHQKILKNVGLLWSMMGVTPNFEGPLGTQIFMGSTEMSLTGQSITVQTPQGVITRPLKKPTSTGSARTRKRKLEFNEETNTFERSPMSRFGQEVSNQLPVLTVQHIDAAIMAETINVVNKGKFLIPIHDAILTDVDSVREYHRTINSKFKEVNKRYNFARAVRAGYTNALLNFKDKIDPQGTYLLTSADPPPNINPHRALHSFILNEAKKLEEKDKLKDKPLTGKAPPKGIKLRDFILQAKRLGWKEEGGDVTGYQLRNLFALVQSYLKVNSDLAQWERASNFLRNRLERASYIKPLIYEYN